MHFSILPQLKDRPRSAAHNTSLKTARGVQGLKLPSFRRRPDIKRAPSKLRHISERTHEPSVSQV